MTPAARTVVVVTGSNSGFGRAIALAMVGRGHRVVATVRQRSKAESLLHEVGQVGGIETPTVVELDVADQAARERAVREIVAQHGRVDVLVNCAGMLHLAALEDTPDETLERLFAVNVVGPLALARLVLPHMRRQGAGRIVNISAIGGVLSTPYIGGYVATKHALDAATAALDLEVRPFGVRAVSVLPGTFRTNLAATLSSASSGAYSDATGAFRAGLLERLEHAPTDLTPVVEAVIAAAFGAVPPQRTVVASPAIDELLAPAVRELNRLHRLEAQRLGMSPLPDASPERPS